MGKQKKLDAEFEKIEAMGGDGKRGVEDARQILTEEKKHDAEIQNKTLDFLTTKRKYTKQEYINSLASIMQLKLYEDEFPPYVGYQIQPTIEGVVLEVSVWQKLFRTAFKACGDPVFDLNAINIFVMQAENTIQKYGQPRSTDPKNN